MADYNQSDVRSGKHADKHKGIGQSVPRAGFAKKGSPPNQSELVSQQNVDWMDPANQ